MSIWDWPVLKWEILSGFIGHARRTTCFIDSLLALAGNTSIAPKEAFGRIPRTPPFEGCIVQAITGEHVGVGEKKYSTPDIQS